MDKLAETLAKFAEKLGIEVVRLWPAIIKVYWAQAIIDRLVWMVILPILGLVAYRLYTRACAASLSAKSSRRDDFPPGPVIAYWICFWITVAVTTVLSIVWCGTLPHAVSVILSPEATFVLDKINP